jgi:hypothetical protein
MVYNTGVMRLFGAQRFAHCAPLLAAALLLCHVALFSWPGAAVPAALTSTDSFQMDQGTKGDGHPLNGSYLAVPGEEAKDGDKGPVRASLLTALLLASFFGMAAGWPLANGRGREALCSPGVVLHLSYVSCQDPPSLGVFRL